MAKQKKPVHRVEMTEGKKMCIRDSLCVLLQDCPLCFNAYAVTIVCLLYTSRCV